MKQIDNGITKIAILFMNIFILFFAVGCGGGSSTSFQTLYKQAEVEHKCNVEFNKQVIALTDQMVVNEKFLIDQSVAFQKILDKKDKESENLQTALLWNQLDNVIKNMKNYDYKGEHFRNYFAVMNNGKIEWRKDGKNGSFYYKNRPIKFYLLKPDNNGKFGDALSAKLELIDFAPSEEKQNKSNDSDSDMLLYGTYGRITGTYRKGWEPEKITLPACKVLWVEGGPYIASDVRPDVKNHISICVIAKPGDLGTGILNGTFPFKEDIAGELLDAYSTFLLNNVYQLTPARQEFLINKYVKGDKNVTEANRPVVINNTNNAGSTNNQNKFRDPWGTPEAVALRKASMRVSSSSALKEGDKVYSASNIVDGDMKTCWADGVPGLGVGESITINFDKNYVVNGFRIFTGHHKSDDLFYKNSRPIALRVIGSDGSNEVYNLEDSIYEDDVYFKKPINVTSLKLVIEKVARGTKYEDTCIAEVSFF